MQSHLTQFRIAISASAAWLSLLLGMAPAREPPAHAVKILSAEQAERYQLDRAFYKKCTEAQGILIASSSQVSDLAHLETAYQFDGIMRSIAAPVAQRIRERNVLCLLIGHRELTSELPQFKTDKTGQELDFYNWRQRGFLTHQSGRPTVVFAEEDVLEFEGGMQLESILVHEFGHVIQSAGFDQALQDRLTDAFERARAAGLWNDGRAAQRFRRVKSKQPVRLFDALTQSFPDQPPELLRKCLDGGDILVNDKRVNSRVKVVASDQVLIRFGGPKECYAHKNRAEYWAEGVQCWFDTNRTMDHDHNHIHTREGLRAYDAHLAKLCEVVLGDSAWRFVSPRQRAGTAHLADFDPAKSPAVADPPHIEKAALDYYDTYWKGYWRRLSEKHALLPKLKAEGVAALAAAARESGSAVRGAILFPQQRIGCAKCHQAGGQQSAGPDLTRLSKELTDAYLVESLLEPSKVVKKGFESVRVATSAGETLSGRIVDQDANGVTLREDAGAHRTITLAQSDIERIAPSQASSMPDGLIEQLADRQEFLDLARYMMELKDAAQNAAANPHSHSTGGRAVKDDLQGLILLDDLNCLACHRSELAASPVPPKRAPNLKWSGKALRADYLERFIADPSNVKPGTTMPDVMAALPAPEKAAAARAIAQYLRALNTALPAQQADPRAVDPGAADRGREVFHTVGCVACHSPRRGNGSEELADASVPLGRLEAKHHLGGLIEFLKDPHAVRPSGRMPNLRLSHAEAVDLASYLLQAATPAEAASAPPELDPALVQEGQRQFRQLGCARCHLENPTEKEPTEKEPTANPQAFPPLTLDGADRGCLSGVAGSWPAYKLTTSEQAAIRAALARGARPLTAPEQIEVALSTFRCVACHQRDDLGGVAPNRDEHFQTTNQNLGPQGRIPPALTGVGAKLQPKWLRDVLISGRTARPYLKTRMPQYGADNVAPLIPLLQAADQLEAVAYADFEDAKEMRSKGHELAGSGGLNCAACHTFQLQPAPTMPALDLTEMAERLQKNWFYHYLRAPQRFSPHTVMPTFWPGGRAMRKDILAGNADLQIEALWQYLLEGRQARRPAGLSLEPIELLAIDEAVMLRRSYGGVGKRGIGVGYPGQVNLVFDAEQMRLAMIWKGRFADPGGVWRSQGHGVVRPLGSDLIRFPAGPELDDATAPWEVGEGRPPEHQFRGYDLDELQRPAFRYRFDGIEVEDYPVDIRAAKSGDPAIRRTLTFVSEKGRSNVAFRVAADKSIERSGSREYLVGGALRILIDEHCEPRILDAAGGKMLQIPLDVPPGKSTLALEYQWVGERR